MKASLRVSLFSFVAAFFSNAVAQATEFQPLGKAIQGVLGTSKAFKKSFGPGKDVFYSKDAQGKAERLAYIEKGVYEPNCTHTWVIGLNAKTQKVTGIEVVEMSCPHAFPTRESSFRSQYVGKGPADVKTLRSQITTIAKATGSSDLMTDAVVRSVSDAVKNKGKI